MKNMNVVGVILLICIVMVACVTAGSYVPIASDVGDGCGTLEISVLCQHNLIGKDMSIQRVDDSDAFKFITGDRISKEQFDQFVKIGDISTIELNPSGRFDGRFSPGIYAIKLFDGNGGQPEYAIGKVDLGYTTSIRFVGHAVSMGNSKDASCVQEISIVSAEYGFTGENCHMETVIDNPAHTEYRFWIYEVQPHTEYKYKDLVVDVPAHVEHQVSTWQIITTEIPAWVEYFGDYKSDGNHYDYVGLNKADYDVTFNYIAPDSGNYYVYDYKNGKVKCTNHGDHGEGWHYQNPACTESYVNHKGNYVKDGMHYDYVGSDAGDYKVDNVIKSGHVHHNKIDAVYGWVVTTSWVDGICGQISVSCVKPGDTKCEERNIPATYKHTSWTAWSDSVPEQIAGRDIETRDGVTTGDWSTWSDVVCSPISNVCQSQEVPAVIHEETVCEGVGSMIDVTSNVQTVVDGGHLSFIFDNRPTVGGIFDSSGEELLSQINDPAYGYVKTVKIVYNNGCDVQDKTVIADEYTVITLDTSIVTPS